MNTVRIRNAAFYVMLASFAAMFVTLDGGVLIRHTGDPGANEFYGPLTMLQENWSKLLDAADLTPTERLEGTALFEAQIGKEGTVAKREPPPSAPPPDYHPPTSQN